MNQQRIVELWDKANSQYYQSESNQPLPQFIFAELIVRECISVAQQQRDPANLNYKPSERFVEDLQRHFGVKE